MAEKSVVWCPIPLALRAFVWAASIAVPPLFTLEQTAHPSVRIQARYSGLRSGPLRGLVRFRRTGTVRVGGTPRCKGTVRRNGTRLLSTIASVFNWRKAPSPGGRTVASQAGRYLFT